MTVLTCKMLSGHMSSSENIYSSVLFGSVLKARLSLKIFV